MELSHDPKSHYGYTTQGNEISLLKTSVCTVALCTEAEEGDQACISDHYGLQLETPQSTQAGSLQGDCIMGSHS